ncbi:hypothetical protein GGI42DRAFT_214144 [Trichoderma sp. SZMC 28013]
MHLHLFHFAFLVSIQLPTPHHPALRGHAPERRREREPWHSNGPLCLVVQPLGTHPSADGASEPNCMQPPPCRIRTLDNAQRVRINYSDANRGPSVRFGVSFNIWIPNNRSLRGGLDAYKSLYMDAAQSERFASVSRTICYITSKSAFITECEASIRLRMWHPSRRFHHQSICCVALEGSSHPPSTSSIFGNHTTYTSESLKNIHGDPSAGCQAGLM